METIAIIIDILFIAFSFYLMWRNKKVTALRLDMIFGLNSSNWREFDELYQRYTFNDMLFSFRPVKLESWYTEEEIRILKGGKSDGED